jgi:hypothetical protein
MSYSCSIFMIILLFAFKDTIIGNPIFRSICMYIPYYIVQNTSVHTRSIIVLQALSFYR